MEIEDKRILKFSGDHILMIIISGFTMILFGLIVTALIISENILFKVIGVGLIILFIYLAMFSFIVNVSFYHDFVFVCYPGRRIKITYEEIKSFRDNKEGFIPYWVIVADLRKKKMKKKKFAFYCPKSKRVKLEEFLKSKGHRIRPEC